MEQADFALLLSMRPENYVLFLILLIFRPLGMLYGFTLFSWGLGAGFMLRVAISAGFGILPFWNNADQFILIASTATMQTIVVTLFIELSIGFLVGALASSPFHAMKYAGAVTDSFRGENNSSLEDPSGGTLTTFGLLYFICAAVAFTQAGGFYVLIENLYTSYNVWPIGRNSATLTEDAWLQATLMLSRAIVAGIAIAAPLLIIFYAVEFTFGVAAKLAPRFNLYENAFVVKNIIAIVTLPLFAGYILRISDEAIGFAYRATNIVDWIIQ